MPAGTFTLFGTLTLRLLDDNQTVAPDRGAGAVKITDPSDAPPPTTLAGFIVSNDRPDSVFAMPFILEETLPAESRGSVARDSDSTETMEALGSGPV